MQKFMGNKAYSEQERADFIELAAEIGITRAMRKLQYPAGWGTAQRWMQAAGVEAPLDEIKAQAKAHHDWYQTEEMLLVGQEQIARIHEMVQKDDLTPDEVKKVAEAYQKVTNTWLLLQGKANNINENRTKDSTDLELMDLYNSELARNALMENDTDVTNMVAHSN